MKKSSVIIIAFFLLLYVAPLCVRPMVFPDEFRYAEIAREMLTSGDWVVPHLDGLRYFEKPVLGHWLNAIAIGMFGENSFAARFFSALAAGAMALMVFVLARNYAGTHLAGTLAAAVLLTCVEVFAVCTFSVLDGMFSAFMTAAAGMFFMAYMTDSAGKRAGLLALFGVFCGLGFLTKGFLAFAIMGVTIIAFLLWQGRTHKLLRAWWIPAATLVSVILPWCVMINLREGDFWRYFFWTEHISRFLSPQSGQHAKPSWFYVPYILGGSFPWLFVLPAAMTGLKEMRLKNPLVRFSLCWLVFPFLLMSASSGKLGTYVLPCFPPLVILMTVGLLKYFAVGEKRSFAIAAYLPAGMAAALLAALILSQTALADFRLFGQYETWKAVLAAVGLLVFALFLLCAGRAADYRRKLAYFALSPVVLMFCVHFVIPDRLIEAKAPGRFLRQYEGRISSNVLLVSDNYLVSAVCWSYRRDDVFLLGKAGELEYGLSYDDSKHRLLNIDQVKELMTRRSGKERIAMVLNAKRYEEYKGLLPKPVFEKSDGHFVFAEFSLQTR
jgi:4-amino-4-deoxy-L-arabinose transferase